MELKNKLNLLSFCTSGGCGAKIGPGELSELLAGLGVKKDPNLLVGFDSKDDAAVYLINEKQAIVSTTDFFPPMLDDPYFFGKIAAANALSDIYAMGGRPLFALNLVCFPEKLDRAFLKSILAGGAAKVLEADEVIAGGHSIFDSQPKFGLAVTGIVDPARILRNDTCKPGDALILTKALGVGLVMAAHREGEASTEEFNAAVASMERLNRYTAEKIVEFDSCELANNSARKVHACTDVTGFGLAVHAMEMAGSSNTVHINSDSLKLLPGAIKFADNSFVTSGGKRNRSFMHNKISMEGLSASMQEIIFDPQTSGGLLIAVDGNTAQELCSVIQQTESAAVIIGKVTERQDVPVIVM